MADVFKPTYTAAVPADAKIGVRDGKRIARFKRKGRTIEAEVTSDGRRVRLETDEWYVRYKEGNRWLRKKAYTDRKASENLAKRIQDNLDRCQEGLPNEENYKRPIADHLTDFGETLRSKSCDKHRLLVLSRVRKFIADRGLKWIMDITPDRVELFLSDLQTQDVSTQTRNHYLASIKQFCNWLVYSGRHSHNPLRKISKGDAEADRRHERRTLSSEEIRALLETTQKSERVFRGLTGPDRVALYYLALRTGFRASELASLTPSSFKLTAHPPTATVAARYSKRRKIDEQPLPPDVAALFSTYLDDFLAEPAHTPATRLWPSSWNDDGARMLRDDLTDARNVWLKQATDEEDRAVRERSTFLAYADANGKVADFHAARHTFITTAAMTLPPKMAQRLARHSTPMLTERYTHIQLKDVGDAADDLPPLLIQVEATALESGPATGEQLCLTAPTGSESDPVCLSNACQKPGTLGHLEAQAGTTGGSEGDCRPLTQLLALQSQTLVRKADGEGFEPPVDFRPQRFSRPPP